MTAAIKLFTDQGDDSDEPTVANVVTWFLEDAAPAFSAKHLGTATHALTLLAQILGSLTIREARSIDLKRWLDKQHADRWRSCETMQVRLAVIQRAFNWAEEMDLIPRNPWKKVRWQRGDETVREMYEEEYSGLLGAAAYDFGCFVRFMRRTGARTAESMVCTWAMVDWKEKQIVIQKHKTRKSQRTPRPRVLQLIPSALELLQELNAKRDSQRLLTDDTGQTWAKLPEHILLTSRGRPWTTSALEGRMETLRTKLGLPLECKLYGLRHRFACDAIRLGIDIKTVSDMLGHSSMATTERYLRSLGLDVKHLQAAAGRLNFS